MNIEAGSWYAVRIGQWIEAARVDGFNPVTGKWIAYLHGMHAWKPLPASAFLRESMDPQHLAAMERRQRTESRLQMQEALWSQESTAPAPVDRAAGGGGTGYESRFYAAVCRQGSRFFAGDYGISRE